MLEKNKDYIEFSMRSMMATHRPCQDDTEIAITGICPGRDLLAMPFDIPCDVVMVPKRSFERLQTENEQLKKKLEEFSPDLPGYREFFTALYPEADVEKMVWATRHIFGCRSQQDVLQSDLEYYRAMSSAQAKSVYNWKEATGCSTPEEAKELIDGKKRRIIELNDELDDSLSANKELIEKRETLEKEIEVYSRALNEWKEGTGCPSPSSTKALIEAGASWHHAYNEIKEKNRKLEEEINELRADYSHLLCTTGFESEGEIEDALDQCDHSTLRKALVDYEFDYEELLKLTGYKSNQDIRVALNYSEQFVYETMRELINSLKRKAKFTESGWKEATGCDSPEAAKDLIEAYERDTKSMKSALRQSNTTMLKEIDNEIDKWQKATGCDSHEAAETTLRNLRGRIDEIKTFAAIASNWTDRIVED